MFIALNYINRNWLVFADTWLTNSGSILLNGLVLCVVFVAVVSCV
jgi:hypothetical protein